MECRKNAAMKLVLFISICVVGCCGNSDKTVIPISGSLLPRDPHIAVGTTLVLNCTLEEPFNTTGVYFEANQTRISSKYVHILSDKVAMLEIPNITAQFLTYFCKWPFQLDGKLYPSQRVQVSHVPGAVRDLTCVVYNWSNMTCTWKPGLTDRYLSTNYTLVYTIEGDLYHCPHSTAFSCNWKKNDGINSYQHRKEYFIRVCAINKMGKTCVEKTVQTNLHVKPDPVTNLNVRAVSSTTVNASWISPTKNRYRPAMFRIIYTPSDSKDIETVEVYGTSVLLKDLRPFTKYRITVAAAPKPTFTIGSVTYLQGGYWSDSVFHDCKTISDVPSVLPLFPRGAYRIENIVGKADQVKVQIYWKKLDTKQANGIVYNYRIKLYQCPVTNNNQSDHYHILNQSKCLQKVVLINANEKVKTKSFELSKTSVYSMAISASSDKGFNDSLIPQPVIVSPEASLNPPWNVVALQTHDGTTSSHVRVNWTQVEGATGYTVYYCYGKLRATCEEDVMWTKVGPNKHATTISLDNRAYMFSVSAEFEGTHSSTGMSPWTNCTYLQDADSIPVSDVALTDHQDGESLTFEWTALKCTQHVYVLHYVISYCPSEHGTCNGERRNITVPRFLEKYKLINLEVDQEYRIVMYTIAPSGVSPASHAVIGTAQPTGIRGSVIAGIVIAALVVGFLMLTGIFVIWRKICKSRQKFLSLGIEVPARINAPREDTQFDKDMLDPEDEENYENVNSPTSTTGLFANSADARHYQDNKENFRREGNIHRNGQIVGNKNNSTLNDESLSSVATLLSGLDSESDTEEDNVFHCDPKTKRQNLEMSTLKPVPEEKLSPGANVKGKKSGCASVDNTSSDEEYHKFAMGNVAGSSSPVLDRLPGSDYLGINNNAFVDHKYVQDLEPSHTCLDNKSSKSACTDCAADQENSACSMNSNNSNSSSHIMSKSLQHMPHVVNYENEGSAEYDSGFQCNYSSPSPEGSPEKATKYESIEMDVLDYAKIASDKSKDYDWECDSKSLEGTRNDGILIGKDEDDELTVQNTTFGVQNDFKTDGKNMGYVVLPEAALTPPTKSINGYVMLPEISPSAASSRQPDHCSAGVPSVQTEENKPPEVLPPPTTTSGHHGQPLSSHRGQAPSTAASPLPKEPSAKTDMSPSSSSIGSSGDPYHQVSEITNLNHHPTSEDDISERLTVRDRQMPDNPNESERSPQLEVSRDGQSSSSPSQVKQSEASDLASQNSTQVSLSIPSSTDQNPDQSSQSVPLVAFEEINGTKGNSSQDEERSDSSSRQLHAPPDRNQPSPCVLLDGYVDAMTLSQSTGHPDVTLPADSSDVGDGSRLSAGCSDQQVDSQNNVKQSQPCDVKTVSSSESRPTDIQDCLCDKQTDSSLKKAADSKEENNSTVRTSEMNGVHSNGLEVTEDDCASQNLPSDAHEIHPGQSLVQNGYIPLSSMT